MSNRHVGSYLRWSLAATLMLPLLGAPACVAQSPAVSHDAGTGRRSSRHEEGAATHSREVEVRVEFVVAVDADIAAFSRQDKPQLGADFADATHVKQPPSAQGQAARLQIYLRKLGTTSVSAPPVRINTGGSLKYAWEGLSNPALPAQSAVRLDLVPTINSNDTITLHATPLFRYTEVNHRPELPPVVVTETHTEARATGNGETIVIADLVNPETWLLMFVTPTLAIDSETTKGNRR